MNPVKINDTTYEVTLPGGDKVEIGDRDALNFRPHLKLNRWDGESFIKVSLPTAARSSPVIEGEKIGWVEPDIEARFYPLGPVTVEGFTRNELGGFEFEVILKEKPPTNQIILEIETQGLKFHYQPPLTPEEIAEGAVRPDNVAGSYAVYHDTRGNVHASAQDAERYKCGKAFHIYRPKIIDADGDWVWAGLNIDEKAGTLTVTIDQDWLDKAVYPVVVDPDFGYSSIGGSTGTLGAGDIRGSNGSPASDGTATSISFFARNGYWTSGEKVRLGLYDASDNSFIAETEERDDGGDGWQAFSINQSVLGAVTYLMAIFSNSAIGPYYDSAAGQKYPRQDNATYPNWPDPITSNTGYQYSIYCTYTTGGGATEKTGSDTGTGADARASGSPAAEVSGSETGSGADALPARDIALPDTGVGADAFVSLQTPAAKAASDTGSGVDACVSLQTPVAKTSSDAGSGVEVVPVPVAFLAGSESGSGIEAFIARLLAAAETGCGAEASEIGGGGLLKHLFASELGEGADGLTAKIEKPTKGGGMRLWI
jgi:hypothetical protein